MVLFLKLQKRNQTKDAIIKLMSRNQIHLIPNPLTLTLTVSLAITLALRLRLSLTLTLALAQILTITLKSKIVSPWGHFKITKTVMIKMKYNENY